MAVTLGFWLIRVTIWIAVAAWLLRLFLEASGHSVEANDRVIRWSWLIGALATVSHIIVAMGVGHCWSLTNAMRHTAMETRRIIGVELPWSVFANFAFAGWWLIDALREFRSSSLRRLGPVRQGVWLLMMLNGTVVFGPPHWKWLAVVCAVAFVLLLGLRPDHESGNKKDSFGNGSPQ